uniref:28 kDa Metastriate family member n=1 Tax=Rhipicephalus zambeziensis TaxID=60191 RepID=A0A224YA77_9ACAR
MIYNVFMMKQFTKAFVCVFMLEFPRITRFIHVAAEGDATKKSIELNAHVLYDFSPNGRYKIDDDPYANAETYFSALFQKVQQSFHNISVPVTIEVKKVSGGPNGWTSISKRCQRRYRSYCNQWNTL